MSELEWDADDYVPTLEVAKTAVTDKWDGEDEDLAVKDTWDDEEDESNPPQTTLLVKKKKKKLSEIVAEKEKRKLEEFERRLREKEEAKKSSTAEEKLAEKLRIQKIQEDSDLQLASDLIGGSENKVEEIHALDEFDLSTSDNLNSFRIALLSKIQNTERLEKKPYYITFLEDFCRDLCQNLEMDDIKRVTTVLNSLYNEKVKSSKPIKGKKKGAGKAKLNPGQGAIADEVPDNRFDDFDDFI